MEVCEKEVHLSEFFGIFFRNIRHRTWSWSRQSVLTIVGVEVMQNAVQAIDLIPPGDQAIQKIAKHIQSAVHRGESVLG